MSRVCHGRSQSPHPLTLACVASAFSSWRFTIPCFTSNSTLCDTTSATPFHSTQLRLLFHPHVCESESTTTLARDHERREFYRPTQCDRPRWVPPRPHRDHHRHTLLYRHPFWDDRCAYGRWRRRVWRLVWLFRRHMYVASLFFFFCVGFNNRRV